MKTEKELILKIGLVAVTEYSVSILLIVVSISPWPQHSGPGLCLDLGHDGLGWFQRTWLAGTLGAIILRTCHNECGLSNAQHDALVLLSTRQS